MSLTKINKQLRMFTILGMLVAMLAPLTQPATTYAASVTSASFTNGGVVVGSTRYAKQGQTLTLTVSTDSSKCVVVTGAHSGTDTSGSNKTSWSFSFAAGTGNGVQTVTATAYKKQDCTRDAGEINGVQTASYTLDNTAPTVTGTLSPVSNGAGWNNSTPVNIAWTATDAGSGVASGPSPASASQAANTTGTTFTSSATDRLGNTASGSVTVKLDATKPTITGSASPGANANGWNNTDVTVTFTCADVTSGIKSCSAPTTLSAETPAAGQSVTGTVVDTADNSQSATVSGIKIDKTAPTLSGAPTTSANSFGWYNGNVAIHWTSTDSLSGIDATTSPADSTISGEGTGLTASASVKDLAGNSSGVTTSAAVNIDRHAPVTTAISPPLWNNVDVTVSLNASDAGSGVDKTFYKLDTGAQQTGTSVAISTQGVHTLQYWSVDKAGNTEAANSVQVKIDKTPPTIGHTASPGANTNGWNNTSVTVTFTCADSLSDIKSCTANGTSPASASKTVTTEGQNQTVTGTAVDNAGNSATDPAKVSIDTTKPTISANSDRAANLNGWYKDDVTVTFTCADALSGLDGTCPAKTVGEGANQSVTGTATDAAGNGNSATLSGINVDKTAPSLTGQPVKADGTPRAPNGAGWYNSDVSVNWLCADGLSGIAACPANSTVTGEGIGLSANISVSDKAGNSTNATVGGLKIDRTAPTTGADAPLGWQNNDVTVNLTANDNLSQVAATYYTLDGGAQQSLNSLTISSNGDHALTFWSVDNAGNTETATTVHVKVDKFAPTIGHSQAPAVNANGWNKTDVTVTFSCADQTGLSGLASCTSPQTVTAEGQNQAVPGAAVDNAGNGATDEAKVSIDKTAPTISAARDRVANTNGWYQDDVTVSFSCADTLSGIKSCPAPQTLGEGPNQSVSGTANDAAGNSATAGDSGINVDKTAPTLTGAPTSEPNTAGWYKTDVAVAWTCSDTLSGLAGACPANSTIGGEGTGLTAGASVQDKAGNSTHTVSSPAVKIDRTAPNTTIDAPSAWVNNNVNVSLAASDNRSGVKATYFTLDGGAAQSGTTIQLSAEGIHTITFWSVDNAGNEEAHTTAQVKIDRTAPTIDHTQDPLANPHGWNNSNVTVTFICNDALSDIATTGGCTGPQTVTGDGKDQVVTGTAKDNAGNTQTDNAQISLDKTAPTISGSVDRAPNAAGWYKDDVTVGFTCGDTLSGVYSCSAPQQLGEGANRSATGTATDAAGNSSSATVGGVNVDKTDPILTGKPVNADGTDRSPNTNGWYNSDVVVAWACGDTLSGIASPTCPAASTVTGEGDTLSASATVTDKAGNTTTTTVDHLKLDRTAPHTAADAPGGWSNQDVTVSLSAQDNLSGVDATYYTVNGGSQQSGTHLTLSAQGVHTISFWSVDKAGNTEDAQSVTVRIDKTAPTITHAQAPAKNAVGWNNGDVTVTFTCADQEGLSGVASCTDPQKVTEEGQDLPVSGQAVDNANNSTTDEAKVSIDRTKPIITGARDRAANDNGWYNANVTVHFTCSDALSGIAGCESDKTLGEGPNQSISGTATDAADNSNSTTLNGINIDKTAPSLSGAPTAAANTNGWYNGDVTVTWSCDDLLSGIDGGCPANTVVTDEGGNLSTGASVSDKAGNPTSASVTGLMIDRTVPETYPSAPSDWTNNNVTVSLTPRDSLSGVDQTYYILDNAPQQSGTAIAISTEGIHTLEFWSVDKAGNREPTKNVQVKIDRTAPTVTHVQAPDKNGAGWNNTNVTVTFTCVDPASGVKSCTTPQTVTADGKGQEVLGEGIDNAGNRATDPALVSLDKTKPTISGKPNRAANAFGWYNSPVTVQFECADALSGIAGTAGCEADHVLDQDGADQSATGTATDAAGNSNSATVGNINVDQAAPSLGGQAVNADGSPRNPNGGGWYNSDVTIHWTATDGLSGIDPATVPANSVIGGEGTTLATSATVQDKAGNPTTVGSPIIKIDRTAPHTTDDAPTSWQNRSVTVNLAAGDNLSGVAATYYKVDAGDQQSGLSVMVTAQGVHTVTFWSVDNAGNSEAAHSVTVSIDTTDPTITHSQAPAANAAGWNKTDVTVTFTCADQAGLSGVASCDAPQTVTTEGSSQSVTGTAADVAGNSANDTATLNIDKTAPAISAATDRDANDFGWYNADVKVNFTCNDTLSGIAACPAAQTLAEGATQSASGTASDAAGNTASAGVSGINVDKTDPTLSGAATAEHNANGWYNSDVTIHWTPADALAGINAATVPADSVVNGEGNNLSASASVSDKAGNTTGTTVAGIKIDRQKPTTAITAPSGWVNTGVKVGLAAEDNMSGVNATYYQLDGGATQVYDSNAGVAVNGQGTHTVVYWSVDNASNEETHTTATVKIDQTAPTISHTQAPKAYTTGWNNGDVTVTFTCADALSGIKSCTTPQTVTTEGADLSVPGTAVDNAGNMASDPATVNIDRTPPTISGAPDRPANANGWYNADVTVSFTCGDQKSLSGLYGCQGPATLHEGANQSVTGTAMDAASNSATATVSGINVDTTAPTLSGKATTNPNAAGWYTGNVTIHWTPADDLSGIDGSTVPADSVLTGEGNNLSTSASVSDKAGNAVNATVAGIKIDRHAPETSSDAPTGWNKGPVTVKLTATDNLSGVAGTQYKLDGGAWQAGTSVTISTEGVHTLYYASSDNAGNPESTQSVQVLIDLTGPAIAGGATTNPNANGWYNGPVTVHFTCSDPKLADGNLGSGVYDCPKDVTLANSGANQSVKVTATDNAGNGTPTTVGGINIDTVKPTVTIGGVQDGAVYVIGAVPTPTCSATDATSGSAGACTGTVTGGANGVGTFTYTATATDKAGNVGTATAIYKVRYGYGKTLFLQPVNDTAHQVGVQTSIFKAGQTVPMKVQLTNAAGQVIQTATAPKWLTPVKGSSMAGAVNEAAYSASATSGFTYEWNGSHYAYNWNTSSSQAGYYWRVGVTLDDGQTYFVNIGLR